MIEVTFDHMFIPGYLLTCLCLKCGLGLPLQPKSVSKHSLSLSKMHSPPPFEAFISLQFHILERVPLCPNIQGYFFVFQISHILDHINSHC
jgi:hypothetical protein